MNEGKIAEMIIKCPACSIEGVAKSIMNEIEIAKDYSEKLKVCKLNVDEAGDIAGEYGVMSIPTLIFFENGKVVDTVVGLTSRSELVSKI